MFYDDREQNVFFNEIPVFVDENSPISVAVVSDSQIGAIRDDDFSKIGEYILCRFWVPTRERAIYLRIDRRYLAVGFTEQEWRSNAAGASPCVGCDNGPAFCIVWRTQVLHNPLHVS